MSSLEINVLKYVTLLFEVATSLSKSRDESKLEESFFASFISRDESLRLRRNILVSSVFSGIFLWGLVGEDLTGTDSPLNMIILVKETATFRGVYFLEKSTLPFWKSDVRHVCAERKVFKVLFAGLEKIYIWFSW